MSHRCLDCPALIKRGSRCHECSRLYENTRSARRGPSGWARQQKNARIMAAEFGLCRICGRSASVIDHIVPLARGGSDSAANKRPLCDSCHRKETRRVFGEGE